MCLWRLLLSVSLLCLMGQGESEPQYLFLTPAMLQSGETVKICVNLENVEEQLNLNVVVQAFGTNSSVFSQDIAPSSFHQCNDFTAPEMSEPTPVFIFFSATGASTNLMDRKTVVVQPTENLYIMQTDKPVYKAGQTMSFRIISLDLDLKPAKTIYTRVYVQDPNNIRLIQWTDQESDHGIVNLSFTLSEEIESGYYRITAERASGYPISEGFPVEEYTLPKFSVTLVCPSTLTMMQEAVSFNYSATYTYGQSVPGTVTARCCAQINVYGRKRNCYKNLNDNCRNITGKLDADGKFSGVFDISSFGLGLLISDVSFVIDVILSEAGTGVQTKETCYIWVTNEQANLRFDYELMNSYYKRRINYPARAILSDVNGKPLPGEVIHFEVTGQEIQNRTTDENGVATYVIDTSDFVMENFTITASYRNPDQCFYVQWYGYRGDVPEYPTAEYLVQRFYSPSSNFFQIQKRPEELSCHSSYSFIVSYALGGGKEACQEEDTNREITVSYLVMGRAKILHGGQVKVDVSNSMNGEFPINVAIEPVYAPTCSLVVYAMVKNELMVDSTIIITQKCFTNEVSLTFSEEKVMPGSNVDLQVTAAPMSLCGLLVADASLSILYPYERFNPDRIFYSLPNLFISGYRVGEFDLEESGPPCVDPTKQIFYNGNYYNPTSTRFEGDTYQILRGLGLIPGTNVKLRKPVVCGKEDEEDHPILRPVPFGGGAGGVSFAKADMNVAAGGAGTVATLRQFFPETFVWEMVNTDSEGRATLTKVIPDTITEWRGSAICTSEDKGFGMTPYHANITAFLPLFLDMSMPSTITRGEAMVLETPVSNFLGLCVKVRVILQASKDFTAELQIPKNNKNTKKDKKNVKISDVCICHKQKASFTWHIYPKVIGTMQIVASAVTSHIGQTCNGPSDPSQPSRNDTVVQTVKVEAEGIKKEETTTRLICVQDTTTEVPLSIPPLTNIVPDSASSYVTIFGDILTLSAHCLESMIRLPTGCGEQIISSMAIIPPVLTYLNNTGQLTPEILEKAKNFLSMGYQQQLRFRHSSGCYTPFESSGGRFNDRDSSCNSWLTARSFAVLQDIKQYVFVDENISQQTLIFLSRSQQLENKCLKFDGYLFWSQGEKEDIFAYNAMLATVLMQSNFSLGETVLEGVMSCLTTAYTSGEVNSLNNKARIGYAFALAGAEDLRAMVLNEMKSKAISEDGKVHWEREDMPSREPGQIFPAPFGPAEVQTAAFVLLIMVKSPTITEEDKDYMAQIVRWLVEQQNGCGGFRSTQDTAVTVKALAEFAELVLLPGSQNTVRISSENGQIAQFDVNPENRLVVQRQSLPTVSGEYRITVSGTGCCLVQNTIQYNVPVPKENAAFALSIVASSKNCLNGVAFTISLNVTMWYKGMKSASNMAIMDIKKFSGFRAEYVSLSKLKTDKIISKWQEKGDHLILYFESISKETVTFSCDLMMERQVLRMKSSHCVIYDYYETDQNGYASFRNPCEA